MRKTKKILIYVVIWDNNEGPEDHREVNVGAFSSSRLAQDWIDEHPQSANWGMTPIFRIEEMELDKPNEADHW